MKTVFLTVLAATAALSAPLAASAAEPAKGAAADVEALADAWVKLQLQTDPTVSYFSGLPVPSHDRFVDRSPAGLAAYEKSEDDLLAKLTRIDARALAGSPSLVTYAGLKEQLEAGRDMRVCHAEWWGVNHMFGWHTGMARIAALQPLGTDDLRAQALRRWGSLPAFADTEIANLKTGLTHGYSAPKSVVDRVVKQVDGMIAADPEKSPFWVLATHDTDPAFQAALRQVITDKINPALKRYSDYLAKEYRPQARETLGLSALPDGVPCYRAFLRSYTTLDRDPKAVFELGQKTVAANLATVKAMGQKLYGSGDLATIVAKTREAPDNRFVSEEELIAYTRATVDAARAKTAVLFERMPPQVMEVKPMESYQRGTGVSSHYEASPDMAKTATYRIQSENWQGETRGGAAITAVHEGWPGHHMQIATAYSTPSNDFTRMSFNSAFVEGWARYSEALSEEAGVYDNPYAAISRRLWPARGMVVDPGVHLYGWSREQAARYMAESGRFTYEESLDTIDRIAVLPGQLTAYDSGALEIFALRKQAEAALGPKFDLKAFHQVVLKDGVVPLPALRASVEAWIAEQRKK
ncbi:DUF885 domain-containing protein [Caulobacter sp. 17J65-9]|uniref:DUF885 domain-containing protein n=1 Tax=Caulobacter sp. 17J65-9 TaxID=2709382 RepID=UPI0013C59C79|nr:DUF885 domain-containing protein [Caulobacter sp. 17J65-9]NEX95039.1 DUF885 domain-containing protein [Caulobacter sp. 17J65-9]